MKYVSEQSASYGHHWQHSCMEWTTIATDDLSTKDARVLSAMFIYSFCSNFLGADSVAQLLCKNRKKWPAAVALLLACVSGKDK